MSAEAAGERLAELYRDIHRTAMSDVPICNDALNVEAVGFREFGRYVLGVIVTPWFANLVAAPNDDNAQGPLPDAARLRLRFPAGDVDFDVSELGGFGRLASCSLFSPMSEFTDHGAARMAAQAALDALFDPHLHDAPKEEPAPGGGFDRRALFGGRRHEPNEKAAP